MLKLLSLISLTSLILMGCGGGDVINSKKVGKIELRQTNISLAKTAASNYNTEDIEAGTVRVSKALFAIWNNVGDAPITDIKITTNNPNLEVAPAFISQLDVLGEASITQIAEIKILHGLDLGTKEHTKRLLPYGRGVSEIYFEGKSNGEIIKDTFTIGYQAIYIDIKFIPDTTTEYGIESFKNGGFWGINYLGEEAEFEGESCYVVLHGYTNLMPGMTILNALDTLPNDRGLKTANGVFSSDPRGNEKHLVKDCAFKNILPKELQ